MQTTKFLVPLGSDLEHLEMMLDKLWYGLCRHCTHTQERESSTLPAAVNDKAIMNITEVMWKPRPPDGEQTRECNTT